MPKFRKKPVVIEAFQIPEKGEPASRALLHFLHGEDNDHKWEETENGELLIHTLEGTMTASCGDYIIKGVKGKLYPCKPDIFEETYSPEIVSDAEAAYGR